MIGLIRIIVAISVVVVSIALYHLGKKYGTMRGHTNPDAIGYFLGVTFAALAFVVLVALHNAGLY